MKKNPTSVRGCVRISFALSCLFLAVDASAASEAISLNLSGNASYQLASTDTAGVVAAANWNNLTNGNTVHSSINDQAGDVVAGLTVGLSGASFSYVNNTPIDGSISLPDAKMMGSAVGQSSNGNFRNVTVLGSSFAVADVYVYFGATGTGATTPYTMGLSLQESDGLGGWTDVTSIYYMTDTNKMWSGTYSRSTSIVGGVGTAAEEKNYILFENVTLTDFRIRSTTVPKRGGITGVQLIAVPEPSQYAIFAGFLMLGFVALKRRRK